MDLDDQSEAGLGYMVQGYNQWGIGNGSLERRGGKKSISW